MDEETRVETEVPTASAESAAEHPGSAHPTASKPAGGSFKEALEKGMESLSKALNAALEDRANVVMVRVNDEALRHLDMLIEAEITKSRSESAAFLINTGIEANQALFEKIGDITGQIQQLRAQLRETVKLGDEQA